MGSSCFDFSGDVLEPHQQVIDDLNVVFFAEDSDERRGDECGEHIVSGSVLSVAEQVIEQDGCQLVSGQDVPMSGVIGGSDGESIGVWVGGHHEGQAILLGRLDCRPEDLMSLGVGQLIWNTSKVRIGFSLRREEFDGVESGLFENGHDRDGSDALKRCVESLESIGVQFEVIGGDGPDIEDGVLVCLVDFGSELADPPIGDSLIVVELGDGGAVCHAIDDSLIVRRQDLSAVGPVGFEAIVTGRVVRGGDDDTGDAVEESDGKRQSGSGSVAVEFEDVESVSCEGGGGQSGEFQ